MEKLINLFFDHLIEPALAPRLRSGSLHGVKTYVSVIKYARLTAKALFEMSLVAAILVTGLAFVVIGAVGLFPIDVQTLAIGALILGLLLFGIGATLTMMFFSQRRWLELSGSTKLIEAATASWPTMMPPNPLAVMRGPAPQEMPATPPRGQRIDDPFTVPETSNMTAAPPAEPESVRNSVGVALASELAR